MGNICFEKKESDHIRLRYLSGEFAMCSEQKFGACTNFSEENNQPIAFSFFQINIIIQGSENRNDRIEKNWHEIETYIQKQSVINLLSVLTTILSYRTNTRIPQLVDLARAGNRQQSVSNPIIMW